MILQLVDVTVIAMRDLFDGKPNLAARRSLPHIDELRRERQNLIDRIRPGVAGVVELRCRLKVVTHKLLKAEVAL